MCYNSGMNLTRSITKLPESLQKRVRLKLREKAILRARARLVESRVDIESLSDEELEVLVADEEDKLLDEYKSRGLLALLALLGLSWI